MKHNSTLSPLCSILTTPFSFQEVPCKLGTVLFFVFIFRCLLLGLSCRQRHAESWVSPATCSAAPVIFSDSLTCFSWTPFAEGAVRKKHNLKPKRSFFLLYLFLCMLQLRQIGYRFNLFKQESLALQVLVNSVNTCLVYYINQRKSAYIPGSIPLWVSCKGRERWNTHHRMTIARLYPIMSQILISGQVKARAN